MPFRCRKIAHYGLFELHHSFNQPLVPVKVKFLVRDVLMQRTMNIGIAVLKRIKQSQAGLFIFGGTHNLGCIFNGSKTVVASQAFIPHNNSGRIRVIVNTGVFIAGINAFPTVFVFQKRYQFGIIAHFFRNIKFQFESVGRILSERGRRFGFNLKSIGKSSLRTNRKIFIFNQSLIKLFGKFFALGNQSVYEIAAALVRVLRRISVIANIVVTQIGINQKPAFCLTSAAF